MTTTTKIKCLICFTDWEEKDNQIVECPSCKHKICLRCMIQMYLYYKEFSYNHEYVYLRQCPFCREDWIDFLKKIYKREKNNIWIFETKEDFENREKMREKIKCEKKIYIALVIITISFTLGASVMLTMSTNIF
jgi:hypothetical protein